MKNDEAAEIRAIFADFKERRIQFYKNIVKDVEAFDNWSISIERCLTYRLLLMNINYQGKGLKEKVMKELEKMQNENNQYSN